MNQLRQLFWAKTILDSEGQSVPGISVQDHCSNVGCVAEALIRLMPAAARNLLPPGAATLAASHDAGKITVGFQCKCPAWRQTPGLPVMKEGELLLSVSDHALVSQVFLQNILLSGSRLWAVAVGAHHGQSKGRNARLNRPEALKGWAEENRQSLLSSLICNFGPLPTHGPDSAFADRHSDVWLLAGLITLADWVGSSEQWFSPALGQPIEVTRTKANEALREIGLPGGTLLATSFSKAFSGGSPTQFIANPLQTAVEDAMTSPGLLVVEGPMGSGKTEAALYAAQRLIASGAHHGFYFALPTQVTSNRIHLRIARFLRSTLADSSHFRLAHGNAWLEDDFDLRIEPAYRTSSRESMEETADYVSEARSWFSSAKHALLSPYGVGTIDQALQAVVAVKHFFVRRFALAGKVVILDEVHSYDVYTGTLVVALIRELINLRCSVIILSATLTAARRRELLAAAGSNEPCESKAYPLVTFATPGEESRSVAPTWPDHREVKLQSCLQPESDCVDELIRRAEGGQHVLWIRNTVVEAQETFRHVMGAVRQNSVKVGLLHSRFPFTRRAELESDWLEDLGRNRPSKGPGSILIATQVVEQSVDIDLDFIISDLAPTDMLLQRVGRLWRHERPHRHAPHAEFWVRLPQCLSNDNAAELRKSLGRSAKVYAPYVLLRTMTVWEGRMTLNIPQDIRPLLEATYPEIPDLSEPPVWQEFREELETEKAHLARNAEAATRVMASPTLDDQEGTLTRRKGPPVVPVVFLKDCIQLPDGGWCLHALDGSHLNVNARVWSKDCARFVHRSIAKVPRWMVSPNPPRPSWLQLHASSEATFAIVRDDGVCILGDPPHSLRYDARVGVFAERLVQKIRPEKDDDEFDY